jgi:hypothetical protein
MATKDVTTQAETLLQVTEDLAELPCAAKNEGLQPHGTRSADGDRRQPEHAS